MSNTYMEFPEMLFIYFFKDMGNTSATLTMDSPAIQLYVYHYPGLFRTFPR